MNMKYSSLRNYEYTVLYSYTVLCMYTKAHRVLKNKWERDCPHNPRGKTLEGTVTEILANAFTIIINSTYENTLIKANLS